ncbi:MarR family transcriptional regulator [Desulfurococcaceae archaeon MEX13E-LK6-19]|nr:MarR family transcriptional regulator [Desulfurococcaceae archaeon MEX13E-LK6-19]
MERKAYELILKHGKKGIYQNDLWKQLGINSREASRIVNKLLKKGLITRKPAINRGRKTYLLIPITERRKRVVKIKKEKLETKIDVDPFLDIPCMRCPYINKCYSGGFYDPIKCPFMDEWLMNEISLMEKKR